jgi:hypothetical protein
MPKQVRFRRGTTAQHSAFTGADGEVTLDTDKRCLVIHDGTIAGGKPVHGFLILAPVNALTKQTLAGVLDITGGDSETYGLSVTNQASFNQVLINEDLQVRRTLHQLQTLTWAASIQIHFANYARYRVTLAGNTTFTSTGWLVGAEPEVHITCDATLRTLTWPAAWVWVGAAAPANIAANKRAVLKLLCVGTNESDVRARWLAEP